MTTLGRDLGDVYAAAEIIRDQVAKPFANRVVRQALGAGACGRVAERPRGARIRNRAPRRNAPRKNTARQERGDGENRENRPHAAPARAAIDFTATSTSWAKSRAVEREVFSRYASSPVRAIVTAICCIGVRAT